MEAMMVLLGVIVFGMLAGIALGAFMNGG